MRRRDSISRLNADRAKLETQISSAVQTPLWPWSSTPTRSATESSYLPARAFMDRFNRQIAATGQREV